MIAKLTVSQIKIAYIPINNNLILLDHTQIVVSYIWKSVLIAIKGYGNIFKLTQYTNKKLLNFSFWTNIYLRIQMLAFGQLFLFL